MDMIQRLIELKWNQSRPVFFVVCCHVIKKLIDLLRERGCGNLSYRFPYYGHCIIIVNGKKFRLIMYESTRPQTWPCPDGSNSVITVLIELCNGRTDFHFVNVIFNWDSKAKCDIDIRDPESFDNMINWSYDFITSHCGPAGWLMRSK